MSQKSPQSLGGIAKGKKSRSLSIKKYYLSPNYCLCCKNIIHVNDKKVAEIKLKKFCNKSCAATFNNSKRIKKEKIPKINRNELQESIMKIITKKELFSRSKNYFSARSVITKQAKNIISKSNLTKKCKVCLYDKHVEVCHIKSVSSFDDENTLFDINNITNLMYLCPNCHWEFDNGLIQIK